MASDNSSNKDLKSRVRKDVSMHNIFSKSDQGQLADIIKQLGNKADTKSLAASVEKNKVNKKEGNEDIGKISLQENVVSDEEITFLLDRLSEFDMEEIGQNSQVYDVYMEKLKFYQTFDNYKKIIKQAKYHDVLVAQLDYLSSKVINQEHQSELLNAQGR